MRIDAHFHVWDTARYPQTWMDPQLHGAIDRTFTMQHWDAARTGFDAGVFVQTIASAEETAEFLALADVDERIAGVVGWLDFDDDVAAQLDRILDDPHGARLVGVRDLTPGRGDTSWFATPAAIDGFRAVGRRGRAVDLLMSPAMAASAAVAIAAADGTRFVLDHIGNVPVGAASGTLHDVLAPFVRADNVVVKVSGFSANAPRDLPDREQVLVEHVRRVVDLFGPDRCVFGSDWPVSTLGDSYGDVVRIVDTAIADLSPTERDSVLGETAARWYRIPPVRSLSEETR